MSLSFFKTRQGLVLLGFLLVVLIAVPITVFLVQQQQNLQQSAHTPSPSVSAFCGESGVVITFTYTITGVPSGATVNVGVADSQNFITDNFVWKNGDPPYTKSVTINQQSISAGVLTFQSNATDGFKKTNQAAYPATGPCAGPTPTDTPIPTETPVPSDTPTPSPTPSPTDTPTPTETPIPSVTATSTPTPTATPVPSSTLTPSPTPTNTPVPGVSDTPTPTPTSIVSPTPTLLATGPSAFVGIGILGLLVLVIGSILLLAL